MGFLKILPPTDYSLKEQGISQSIMNNFYCRKKLMLVLNRWRQKLKTGTFYGTAFHDSFEAVYKRPLTEFSEKMWLKALGESQMRQMKDPNNRSQQVMEIIAADYKLLSAVFPRYLDHWKKKDLTRKWVSLEKPFDYLWQGKYRLRGKIDGIFSFKGKNWIIEHKTKSRIDEDVLNKVLAFNFQNLMYIMACEEDFKIPIAGVLYDIIRKPGTKQKQGETWQDYVERLNDDITKEPGHFFKRIELIYTKADKDNFKEEFNAQLQELEDMLAGTVPIIGNPGMCSAPYPCAYLDTCSSGSFAGLEQSETLFTELEEE